MSDYGSILGISCPGAVADSGDYNIDGACVVHADDIEIHCGKIVHVKQLYHDGYKEVSAEYHYDGDVPYGVMMRGGTDYVTDDGMAGYDRGDCCPVISHGRVWALSRDINTAPAFGEEVKVDAKGYASVNGKRVTGWAYTGGYARIDAQNQIVEIDIKQNAAHGGGAAIKVNGAVITATPSGSQLHGTPIVMTVSVSPEDATNKVGSWHLVEGKDKGTLERLDDFNYRLVPAQNFVGELHVVWTAEDGSGVQSMYEPHYYS